MDAMTNIRINKELRDEIASLKTQLAECKKVIETMLNELEPHEVVCGHTSIQTLYRLPEGVNRD
jgi:hypothetical protein